MKHKKDKILSKVVAVVSYLSLIPDIFNLYWTSVLFPKKKQNYFQVVTLRINC